MTTCIIAEDCRCGSKILFDEAGFLIARVKPEAYRHLGTVDLTRRILDMREAFHRLRRERERRR